MTNTTTWWFLEASSGLPGGFLGISCSLHLFDWTLQHSFGSSWGVTGEFLGSFWGVTGELLGTSWVVPCELLRISRGLHVGLL